MTVENQNSKSGPYALDGSTLRFPRQFYVQEAGQLRVFRVLNGVETEITTGFTQTGIREEEGEVVFTEATYPAGGGDLVLKRDIPITQETDYSNQARVRPEQVEEDLDNIVRMIQDIKEVLGRGFRLSIDRTPTEAELEEMTRSAMALSGAIDEVNTLAASIAELLVVYGSLSDIQQVAGDIANILMYYEETKKAGIQHVQQILVQDGVSRYSRDAAGDSIYATKTNSLLFGPAPHGPLAYGPDWTTDNGAIVLLKPFNAGDLLTLTSLQRVNVDGGAQAILQEFEDRVASDRAAAEAAALASQWFFDTKADAEAWSGTGALPESINIRGADSVDDGMGGFYVRGLASSDNVTVSGVSFGRLKDIQPNRIARSKSEKWLLTADWQPVPEQAADVAYLRNFLNGVSARHPDIDYAVFAGDLVDRASEDGTGAAPPYGFAELRTDIETRLPQVPWDRWLFLPGNHDRDGTGTGSHRKAWTLETYRRYIGPEFYSVRKGNVVQIFLGDMSGSVSGEVMDWALTWFRNELEMASGCNIIVWMHQPLHGVHPSSLSETSAWSQINGGTRLAPLLTEFAGQILFVGYGHVGFGIETGATVSQLYGVTHVNFSLAIPNLRGGTAGVYSILHLREGAATVTIDRWNSTTHEPYAGASVTLPVYRPLQLGGATFDRDGRDPAIWHRPVVRGPAHIYGSLADFRKWTGTEWRSPLNEAVPLLRLTLADDANDAVGQGAGVGIAFDVAGKATQLDDQEFQIQGQGSYGLGGAITVRRGGASQENREGYMSFLLRGFDTPEGFEHLEEIATLYPTTKGTNYSGLNLKAGASIRVGGHFENLTPGTASNVQGVDLREVGYVTASRDSFVGLWQRQASDGILHGFYRGTTSVGSINVTATATAYNTTSDATLKEDERPLTFEVARAILEMIAFYDFQWKSTGQRDLGVFAQELHEIYPSAVSVGGWFLEDGSPASAVEVGATYTPWAVDYSKLIPVVAACVQGLLSGQDEIKSRLAALEKTGE